MGVGADVIGRSAPTPYEAVRGRVMSHPDATVKPSVGHIRLFGGMDVKRSNVVRVPPPTHPGVGGVHDDYIYATKHTSPPELRQQLG